AFLWLPEALAVVADGHPQAAAAHRDGDRHGPGLAVACDVVERLGQHREHPPGHPRRHVRARQRPRLDRYPRPPRPLRQVALQRFGQTLAPAHARLFHVPIQRLPEAWAFRFTAGAETRSSNPPWRARVSPSRKGYPAFSGRAAEVSRPFPNGYSRLSSSFSLAR